MAQGGGGGGSGSGGVKHVPRFRLAFFVRQAAALLLAATVAIEYVRSVDVLSSFSFWTLFLNFIYFQLPLKSRALAWFHPVTFVASFVTPAQYGLLLFAKPRLEYDRMEIFEISITTVLVRSFLIYLAPLCFHALDIAINRDNLAVSYSLKPRKLMLVWACIGYGMLELAFFFLGPVGDPASVAIGMDSLPSELALPGRCVTAFVSVFAALLLYLSLIKHAYGTLA